MDVGKGIIAGFVATVVLSAIMLMKAMIGFMPELDISPLPVSLPSSRR